MELEVENGIKFSILQSIDKNIDENVLLKLVKEQEDCYTLKVYGYSLKFSKIDGGLL